MTDPDLIREGEIYRKRFLLSLLIPATLVFLMWCVKLVETLLGTEFTGLGIYPLEIRGMPGIILSPFIHSGFRHLFDNSLPFLLLSTALFFFYREIALRIFILNWFITGLLVWFGGRAAWHIGASGLVYGLASFLFFSGIIRKYYRLVALSLLVVFLYGQMVWGIFPDIYKNVSWESHMLGFFSGVVLAVIFHKQGPQAPVQEWPEDDEERGGEWESGRRGDEERVGEWEKGGKEEGEREHLR